MDDVLYYANVPVTIHSYPKATGKISDPRDTRHAQRRITSADTVSTSEEVSGLKTNDDRTFTLDGGFYPLKSFVPEEIFPGGIYKVFQDVRREKIWVY